MLVNLYPKMLYTYTSYKLKRRQLMNFCASTKRRTLVYPRVSKKNLLSVFYMNQDENKLIQLHAEPQVSELDFWQYFQLIKSVFPKQCFFTKEAMLYQDHRLTLKNSDLTWIKHSMSLNFSSLNLASLRKRDGFICF